MRAVEFVGIFVQDTEHAARNFIREFGLVFPAGLDPNMKIANAYGLIGLPLAVFISPKGGIVERITRPMSEKEMIEKIEKLLLVRKP